MAQDFDAHMFESDGAFTAIVKGLGRFRGRTLADLRHYVMADAERVWSENANGSGEIEFSISADLRVLYPRCETCEGRGKVKSDRVGVQYLAGIEGTMDWSARADKRCNACEGTGAKVPGFGTSAIEH